MANQQTSGNTQNNKMGLLAELVNNARLAWRLMTDSRVAMWTKLAVPALMGAYLFWPADLLPDVLPGLGQLDDLAVLLLGVRLFIKLCPIDIVNEHLGGLDREGKAQRVTHTDSAEGEVVDGQYRVIEKE